MFKYDYEDLDPNPINVYGVWKMIFQKVKNSK